ncbi:peptidoglycan-binding protein [Streptomyces sp. NPDC088746]|uniref:peptidoglycan-binding protein n=1 Tax=Streptomyces sp. NPDC088746 TaxID=3365885 RepID=UPI003815DBB7
MPAHEDLPVALGQQVLDQLLRTYVTAGAGKFALAVLPGQAVDDDMVQNGVVNQLLVSEWLRTDYDFPLLLRLSDCTPIPAALGTGISASSVYTLIAQYSRPAAAPDTDAGERVQRLLNAAKQDLGPNPGALPLGLEPDDWAAPSGAVHWQTFDTTVTASQRPPQTEGTSLPNANPDLWQLRAEHSTETVPDTPRSTLLELDSHRVQLLRTAMDSGDADVLAPSEVVNAQEDAALRAPALRLLTSLRPSATPESPAADEAVPEAATTSAPTAGGDLRIHFEHSLVRLVRRFAGASWWHPQLTAEPGWYVPGMRRGQLVPDPPGDGTAHCLPQALLLVRDIRITGSWTAEAYAALGAAAPAFGPFLLRSGAVPTADNPGTTTVQGLGTQVIGILGTPMPTLPPIDDPGRPPPAAFVPFPGTGWFKKAPKSPVVLAMGRRLVEEGCSAYAKAPGPQWTQADRASFTKWQHRLGYRGADADGYPGPASWKALRVPNGPDPQPS